MTGRADLRAESESLQRSLGGIIAASIDAARRDAVRGVAAERDALAAALHALLAYEDPKKCEHKAIFKSDRYSFCRNCARTWRTWDATLVPYDEPPTFTAARATLVKIGKVT